MKLTMQKDLMDRLAGLLTHPSATPYLQPPDVRYSPEEPDPVRNIFQVDKERIILSKAFRRLKHKTQVIWSPKDAHFRTRLTHTLDVAQLAYVISTNLGLNPDLTQAIAYAHDIGHPPFGHAGERAVQSYLHEYHERKGGDLVTFDSHSEGVRILQKIERFGNSRGLNLTKLALDGIQNASQGLAVQTLEAQVVQYADDLSYITQDFEEFQAIGINLNDSYLKMIGDLGKNRHERITKAIEDIYQNTTDEKVGISPDLDKLMKAIRNYENKEIFQKNRIWVQREKGVHTIIRQVMDYFMEDSLDDIEIDIRKMVNNPSERITIVEDIRADFSSRLDLIVNYTTRMTDTFALDLYEFLFSPQNRNYYF